MKNVEIDLADEGGFVVHYSQGIQPSRSKTFAIESEAEAFAYKKCGVRGILLDSRRMTPEQRQARKEREARLDKLYPRANAGAR